MSSIRNAVQRRVHRERAQPQERQRLGLLEKHKDYSLRAKDFNKKKAQLRALRQKAADRNEDEFYFGMMSRKGPGHALSQGKRWVGTVNGDRGNKSMDVDTVRLLKTQDMGYIRTVRNAALKEVKQLEERVIGLGGSLDEEDWEGFDDDEDMGFAMPKPTKAKKIVFTEGVEEREEILQHKKADEEEDLDMDEEDDDAEKSPEKLRAKERQKLLGKLQKQLQNARKKLKVLTRTEYELDVQRAKMAKTATSMNGVTKSGKKFKIRERKR
ncbi:U3 small nucleolar RNA-associated protein 11 [Rostrohypoxylon terebratum]|nr:U3 small nucleolar RNA-associated protein 11 [Rostrohypoxylon terebratum]